ncbi:MAG: hypothetical protein GC136_03625 [Alphaproteobacteria bacterium]|nr:hypothetical protein [Alphaproteobacteria bacterium]
MYIRVERVTGSIILAGWFSSFKMAVEYAFRHNFSLRELQANGEDLSGISLRGADLRGASLARTDLRDADLSFANLQSADLTQARLENALLDGAKDMLPTKIPCKIINNTTIRYKLDNAGRLYQKLHYVTDNKRQNGFFIPLGAYFRMTQCKKSLSTSN